MGVVRSYSKGVSKKAIANRSTGRKSGFTSSKSSSSRSSSSLTSHQKANIAALEARGDTASANKLRSAMGVSGSSGSSSSSRSTYDSKGTSGRTGISSNVTYMNRGNYGSPSTLNGVANADSLNRWNEKKSRMQESEARMRSQGARYADDPFYSGSDKGSYSTNRGMDGKGSRSYKDGEYQTSYTPEGDKFYESKWEQTDTGGINPRMNELSGQQYESSDKNRVDDDVYGTYQTGQDNKFAGADFANYQKGLANVSKKFKFNIEDTGIDMGELESHIKNLALEKGVDITNENVILKAAHDIAIETAERNLQLAIANSNMITEVAQDDYNLTIMQLNRRANKTEDNLKDQADLLERAYVNQKAQLDNMQDADIAMLEQGKNDAIRRAKLMFGANLTSSTTGLEFLSNIEQSYEDKIRSTRQDYTYKLEGIGLQYEGSQLKIAAMYDDINMKATETIENAYQTMTKVKQQAYMQSMGDINTYYTIARQADLSYIESTFSAMKEARLEQEQAQNIVMKQEQHNLAMQKGWQQLEEGGYKNMANRAELGIDTVLEGVSGTLADRNNNPGNLRDPKTGEFRQFENPTAGFEAMTQDLTAKLTGNSPAIRNKLGRNAETLLDVISVYAPKEDNNDPNSYANAVASEMGISPEEPVANLIPRVNELAKAMAKHEGFTGEILLADSFKNKDSKFPGLTDNQAIRDIMSGEMTYAQINALYAERPHLRKIVEKKQIEGIATGMFEGYFDNIDKSIEEITKLNSELGKNEMPIASIDDILEAPREVQEQIKLEAIKERNKISQEYPDEGDGWIFTDERAAKKRRAKLQELINQLNAL